MRVTVYSSCGMYRTSAAPSRMSVPHPSRMSVPRPSRWSLAIWCIVSCASAFSPHDETFRYQVVSSRRSEACTMCFGDECWEMQKDRCRYYAEVNDALSGGTEPGGQGGEVDDLVYDMVGQAAASWLTQDCIPLISHRTNCNKENICMGCQTCSCNPNGKWNCNTVQQCRPEPELDVDHRILVLVAETLKSDKLRKKRSTNNKTDNSVLSKINYMEIAEWMYGVNPNVEAYPETIDRRSNDPTAKTTPNDVSELTTEKEDNDESETGFIKFDEVLKNIAVDTQKYKRRKAQLNESNYDFNDYMDLDESIVVKTNETDNFVNILNAIIEDNENVTAVPITKESTKVVIDLLVPSKKDENINISKNIDLSSNIIKEEIYADDGNDTSRFNVINIMKRDVTSVLGSNLSTEATTAKSNNTEPERVTKLKNNVLIPITKIIDDKQQELKDLIKIKENLIQFINDYNDTGLDVKMKSQEIMNSTKTVLSIYNLDIFPEIQFNLRKINPNSLDKLLYKLKRDIYEVIRDVVGIKKLSETNKLQDDLADLIRAMSIYVHKHGNVTNIIKYGIKLKDDHNSRRNKDGVGFNSTKAYLIKILEVLDKDMPQTDALSPLSLGTRKVVKRVIKNHYTDDFSVIGLRVYEPEYNLTNDLRNVGSKWQFMTANVAASAPTDKMYAMKLLHFTLLVDISKLADALALIDFAHSRRMIPIEGSLGEQLLDKINNGLKSIDNKIKIITQYHLNSRPHSKVNPTLKPSKRKSFMNKIRNLLRGSKGDIVDLVNKKVPRSEIVKTIAKKRLDELARKRISEYQETMRKWQNTLNVIPRYKRSLDLNGIHTRMNNIIPKYLRGKLNPAIAAHKYKKPRQVIQNNATLKKQYSIKQKKKTTTVKPKMKSTNRKNSRNSRSTVMKKTTAVSSKSKSKDASKPKAKYVPTKTKHKMKAAPTMNTVLFQIKPRNKVLKANHVTTKPRPKSKTIPRTNAVSTKRRSKNEMVPKPNTVSIKTKPSKERKQNAVPTKTRTNGKIKTHTVPTKTNSINEAATAKANVESTRSKLEKKTTRTLGVSNKRPKSKIITTSNTTQHQ